MSIGRAHSGGANAVEGVLPFMEIIHDNNSQNLTLTASLQAYIWTATPLFDTMSGAVTFDGVDEITIVETATYRFDYHLCWTTAAVARIQGLLEIDPLGVGSYAFVIRSPIYADSEGSLTTGSNSITLNLNATDKVRMMTRALVGAGNTQGDNGSTWRINHA